MCGHFIEHKTKLVKVLKLDCDTLQGEPSRLDNRAEPTFMVLIRWPDMCFTGDFQQKLQMHRQNYLSHSKVYMSKGLWSSGALGQLPT